MERWKCEECGHILPVGDWLTAPNPFEESDTLYGCPECFSIDRLRRVCAVEGCTEVSTCGTPTKQGYLVCCGKHYREATARPEQLEGD